MRVRPAPLIIKRLDLQSIIILNAWERREAPCTAAALVELPSLLKSPQCLIFTSLGGREVRDDVSAACLHIRLLERI